MTKIKTVKGGVSSVLRACKGFPEYYGFPIIKGMKTSSSARYNLRDLISMTFRRETSLKKDSIDSYLKGLKEVGIPFNAVEAKKHIVQAIADRIKEQKESPHSRKDILKLSDRRRLSLAVNEWFEDRAGLPATKESVKRIARKYSVPVKKLADNVLYDE